MEFRKMRRSRQELDHEACLEMINRATSGVLSVTGDEGYPYGVPMSYVYVDGSGEEDFVGTFYFHCAKTGHKIDALRACDKACFTIIDRDDVVADEFTTYFKSVIAFGRVRILETTEEILPAIRHMIQAGVPVMGHLGLTPQSVNQFGGYGLRAKECSTTPNSWTKPAVSPLSWRRSLRLSQRK